MNRPHMQQGMATLWTAVLLVLITSLIGGITFQAAQSETIRSQHQMFAAQALATSEALLETSMAYLESAYTHHDATIDMQIWANASASQCPANKGPPQWQCLKWAMSESPLKDMPALTGADSTDSHVQLVRDVRNAPHRLQVIAQAQLSATQPGAGSRASVQQSLFIPLSTPLLANMSETPTRLILNAPSWGPALGECLPLAWRQIFGQTTPLQLKTISAAQLQNGLTASSQPTRSVYWVDSPLLWTQSIGSELAPVVLIFSETACALHCPSLASTARIVGTVFFESQCQDLKMLNWQSTSIAGQVGVASGLPPGQAAIQISALPNSSAAFNFDCPPLMNAAFVQRVSGTWKNAGY